MIERLSWEALHFLGKTDQQGKVEQLRFMAEINLNVPNSARGDEKRVESLWVKIKGQANKCDTLWVFSTDAKRVKSLRVKINGQVKKGDVWWVLTIAT